MSNQNGVDRYKELLKAKEEGTNVYDELIDSANPNNNANLPDNVEVNVTSIPVAKKKTSIRDTHKSKAFYIRKDIAKLIEQDIRNSSRGDMTKIANALFEEYYRSQGRIKDNH